MFCSIYCFSEKSDCYTIWATLTGPKSLSDLLNKHTALNIEKAAQHACCMIEWKWMGYIGMENPALTIHPPRVWNKLPRLPEVFHQPAKGPVGAVLLQG